MTIWVEVHGRPLSETADDSSIMHRLADKLDALADKLGVTRLSAFYDYSELESAYGDFEEDSARPEVESDKEPALEGRQADGEWFDSAVGLRSVQAIRRHLSEHLGDLEFTPDHSTAHWPKQLMDELKRSEAILQQAAQRGQRFRLLIVP